MKRIVMLLLLIMCIPVLGFGAEIYGNLRVNNASVGKGVLVRIQCGNDPHGEALTDDYGSYKIPLRLGKDCQLSVYHGNQWAIPFKVYPYEDPVRYDFDLLPQPKGPAALRRI